MTIYGIASVVVECVGHGDYVHVEAIRPARIDFTNLVYPPFFLHEEDAKHYIDDEDPYHKVVALDVHEGPITL